jgi:hypothetical protein
MLPGAAVGVLGFGEPKVPSLLIAGDFLNDKAGLRELGSGGGRLATVGAGPSARGDSMLGSDTILADAELVSVGLLGGLLVARAREDGVRNELPSTVGARVRGGGRGRGLTSLKLCIKIKMIVVHTFSGAPSRSDRQKIIRNCNTKRPT